jgi:hypothetical protein
MLMAKLRNLTLHDVLHFEHRHPLEPLEAVELPGAMEN